MAFAFLTKSLVINFQTPKLIKILRKSLKCNQTIFYIFIRISVTVPNFVECSSLRIKWYCKTYPLPLRPSGGVNHYAQSLHTCCTICAQSAQADLTNGAVKAQSAQSRHNHGAICAIDINKYPNFISTAQKKFILWSILFFYIYNIYFSHCLQRLTSTYFHCISVK